MLSVSPPRSTSGAVSYYLHLTEGRSRSIEDYYAKEGEGGRWIGGGATGLGLTGEVGGHDFQRLADGFAPGETGKGLVQNAGHPKRVAGWDLTFSAPKSVSCVWAVADDLLRSKIEAAHARAVEQAFSFMQEKAGFVRTGQDGRQIEAAQLVGAAFQHGTSRELDPQLHSHVFVFNQGLRSNGKWASLESRGLYDWQKVGGAAYRVALAHSMRELGLKVERDGESFRIAGVSRDLEGEWSKRRDQILAALREKGFYSPKAAETAALDTRQAKQREIEPDQLRPVWKEDAKTYGVTAESLTATRATEAAPALQAPTTDQILGKATEHESVLSEKAIYLEVFQAAQGVHGYSGALDLVKDTFDQAIALEGGNGKVSFTTSEMLAIEREILADALEKRGDCRHQVAPEAVTKILDHYETSKTAELVADGVLKEGERFQLREEQREAVRFLATQSGGVAIMVGDAGTGKTTALEALRGVYEAAGYQVVGTSIGGKAAAGLEQESGIKSATIAKHLRDIDNGRLILSEKTILVVDEAGMTDARSFHQLMTKANDVGAKIVYVGDPKQLQAVGAGTAFRHMIQEFVENGYARLSTVVRQHDAADRTAVTHLSKGEAADAFKSYIDRGLVDIKTTHHHAVQEIARQYVADVKEVGASQVLIAADSNRACRDINAACRDALKTAGQLKGGRLVEVAGEQQSRTIELAAGERVLVTANDRDTGLRNGDFATVTNVREENGKVSLTLRVDRTRETLEIHPAKIQMRHGYAATAHRLQGATATRAIVYGTARCYRELAYVEGSRSREAPRWVFTSHAVKGLARDAGLESAASAKDPKTAQMDQLKSTFEAMSRSQEKKSTLDYIQSPEGRKQEVIREISKIKEASHAIQSAHQSNPGEHRELGAPAAPHRLRDLPAGDLVRNGHAPEVPLPRDAFHKLEQERKLDSSLRREGAGDIGGRGAGSAASIVSQVAARIPELHDAAGKVVPSVQAKESRIVIEVRTEPAGALMRDVPTLQSAVELAKELAPQATSIAVERQPLPVGPAAITPAAPASLRSEASRQPEFER